VSDPICLALLIPALPLAAAVLAFLFNGSDALKPHAHWPLIFACGAAAVLAVGLLLRVANGNQSQFVSAPVTWFAAGKLTANFTITVDPLACVMLGMITFVSTWIAIFSSGYMRDADHRPDAGYARFFGVMSLFVFSMCGLVLANNFLLLVAFWEGVGLCSYLLVGYYYNKPSAAQAARKAFLVTRLGDTGLLLGIFLFWRIGGYNTDFTALFEYIRQNPPDPATLTLACLLIFCGAVGKSAQFPLYVWLPDAMEGPTPVSALIHAATMVTAGVYLVARTAPLFALSPDAQVVVAWTGGITAILAAFIAVAQSDLKRVLAYSTVSQLGFMFLALGTLGTLSPVFAVTAALFHLFTHAFFKALLFLASGSVMHAMGDVIDMRRFGGLRRVMPVTHVTFLIGAAALAGVPSLSGFWSKDMILEALQEAGEGHTRYAGAFYFLLLVALLTAFLTAFYTFRAYFLTFWGETRVPEEAGHHTHESPAVMTVPLVVLAVGALVVGIVLEPFNHAFSHFLGRTPSLNLAEAMTGAHAAGHAFNWGLAGVSTLVAVGGITLAFMWYGSGGPGRVPPILEPVYALSRDKLYVDEVYYAAVVKPAETLAFLARVFDLFLDSVARLVSAVPRFFGALVRPVQNGLVQFYALSMALGLVVFVAFVAYRITRPW
jgi:NADH-quinone oxidoreductase subunit L